MWDRVIAYQSIIFVTMMNTMVMTLQKRLVMMMMLWDETPIFVSGIWLMEDSWFSLGLRCSR